jgi:hypothetical protein
MGDTWEQMFLDRNELAWKVFHKRSDALIQGQPPGCITSYLPPNVYSPATEVEHLVLDELEAVDMTGQFGEAQLRAVARRIISLVRHTDAQPLGPSD